MTEAEEKVAEIIWENEPMSSKDLVLECEKILNWKKSTTYTILKRLEEKNIFKNEKSILISLVSKNEYLSSQGCKFIDTNFNGSLPDFFAAFTRKRKLSKKEILKLKEMIESYEED